MIKFQSLQFILQIFLAQQHYGQRNLQLILILIRIISLLIIRQTIVQKVILSGLGGEKKYIT